MKSIKNKEIDKKFIVPHEKNDKCTYIDVISGPFEISGFPWIKTNKSFCRLDTGSLHKFSKRIQELAWNTSGGMVRL